MSSKTIEIKAMTKEEAIKRALNIFEAREENIVNIIEIQKSKSFLGLFTKEGVYSIEIDKDKKVSYKNETHAKVDITQKEIKKDENKKRESKKDEIKREENKREENKKEENKKEENKKEENKREENKREENKKDIYVPEKKYDDKVNQYNKLLDKTEEKTVNQYVLEGSSNELNNIVFEDISESLLEKTEILLEKMGLNLEAKVIKNSERSYLVNIYGEDNGIIIGKKGKTLNNFEYILKSIFKRYRIEVDVEGFKEKRYDTLKKLARKMAEKTLKTNKMIKLNPMPAKERKIIHEVMNRYAQLETYSEGKDPKRYIVIKRKK
ncbi:MAG: KH domain-containing protein [Fusobacteriaceae bacterium]|jgi:spoIIIJ-associated protein|nr:KH domain-containing protein [Fusobacteriaceae bacterium]